MTIPVTESQLRFQHVTKPLSDTHHNSKLHQIIFGQKNNYSKWSCLSFSTYRELCTVGIYLFIYLFIATQCCKCCNAVTGLELHASKAAQIVVPCPAMVNTHLTEHFHYKQNSSILFNISVQMEGHGTGWNCSYKTSIFLPAVFVFLSVNMMNVFRAKNIFHSSLLSMNFTFIVFLWL